MSFGVKEMIKCTIIVILLGFNASTASADDYSERLAEKYIETAFRGNSGLVKFAVAPRVTFVCPESNCVNTVKSIKELMPQQAFSEVSTRSSGSSEILVVFESRNSHESAEFVEIARQSYSKEVDKSTWGEPVCSVTQFTQGNEVKKLIISVKQEEGDLNNISCITFELIRGSGGQIAGTYAKFSEQFRKMNDQIYSGFRTGANFFLRVHWSPNLRPGTTKEDARAFVVDRIR